MQGTPRVPTRRTAALACLSVIVCASSLLAQASPSRKLSDSEKKELSAIATMLASGSSPRDDFSMAWGAHDLLKAQGNKEYVPFSVTIDPAVVRGGALLLYWRAVSKDAPPPPPTEPGKKDKDRTAPEYAFENLHTLVMPDDRSAALRVTRSIVVPAGRYDIFVVAKEPEPGRKNAPPARVSVLRHELAIDDLWNGELTTSSVMVADRIDPLPVPLTPTQQEERPYALGTMEIVPAPSTVFPKSKDFSVFLLIYNARLDQSSAPDVSVEYNFYATQAGVEKFFNKTSPQALNGQTLPAGFDPAAGITNGQTVPLASFPEGEYRLEIKITDKLANKSLTRDVRFSVAGS